MAMCKKEDKTQHQKSRFILVCKGVGLSFRHLTLKKSLKRFITKHISDV